MYVTKAAFDDAQCNVALQREHVYRAGCNFFWLNHFRSLVPGVPLPVERVMDVVDEYFQKTGTFQRHGDG